MTEKIVNLSTAIINIESALENTRPEALLEEWAIEIGKPVEDDRLFSKEEIEALAGVCSTLGIPYSGVTLELYLSNGAVKISKPRLMSNGRSAGVVWGGEFYPLDDELPVWSIRTISTPSLAFRIPKLDMLIPILLDFDRNNERAKAEAENAFADCETFGQLKKVLIKNLEILKGDALWNLEGGSFRVIALTRIQDGDKDYWVADIQTDKEGSQARMFMGASTDVAVGDGFKIDAENRVITNQRTKKELELGGFIKLHELVIGVKYTIVKIAPKTGEYGGFNLTVPGVGLVGSNTQIENWIFANGAESVTASTPAVLEITAIRESKGKHRVDCLMSVPGKKNDRQERALAMAKAKKNGSQPVAESELPLPFPLGSSEMNLAEAEPKVEAVEAKPAKAKPATPKSAPKSDQQSLIEETATPPDTETDTTSEWA